MRTLDLGAKSGRRVLGGWSRGVRVVSIVCAL